MLCFLMFKHPFSKEITRDNVMDIIGKDRPVLAHFFSEGCKHCEKMAPEWNEMTRIYHGHTDVDLAVVDCSRFKSICANFESSSTPSVKYFAPHDKTGELYGGKFELIPMVKWVKGLTSFMPLASPGKLLFVSPEEIEEQKRKSPIFLVADDPIKSALNHTILREGENHPAVLFRAINIHKYPNVLEGTTMSLLLDDQVIPYKGEVDIDDIYKFIDEHIHTDEM